MQMRFAELLELYLVGVISGALLAGGVWTWFGALDFSRSRCSKRH